MRLIDNIVQRFKGNPVAEAIKRERDKQDSAYRSAAYDMMELSLKLEKAFDVAPESNDLELVRTDHYILSERNVCFHSIGKGWVSCFIVTPAYVGHEVGWSNIPHKPFPPDWAFFPQGTATVVVPPREKWADIIEQFNQRMHA